MTHVELVPVSCFVCIVVSMFLVCAQTSWRHGLGRFSAAPQARRECCEGLAGSELWTHAAAAGQAEKVVLCTFVCWLMSGGMGYMCGLGLGRNDRRLLHLSHSIGLRLPTHNHFVTLFRPAFEDKVADEEMPSLPNPEN